MAKWRQPRCPSTDGQDEMNKQIVVYPYNEVLVSDTKDLTLHSHNNMGKSHMHSAGLKKPDTKEYIWYDSIDRKCQKIWNYNVSKKQKADQWLLEATIGGGCLTVRDYEEICLSDGNVICWLWW